MEEKNYKVYLHTFPRKVYVGISTTIKSAGGKGGGLS